MAIRVGINGLGRIGRTFLRLAWGRRDIEVVAVNDLADPRTLAHLLRFDSISGPWNVAVEGGDTSLSIQGRVIPSTGYRLPGEIPWEREGVQVVLEATGLFRDRKSAEPHLRPGVRRVIISAPSPDADLTVVMGVNHHEFHPSRHLVLSNASCTTNCLAPILMLVENEWGVEAASLSTIHCYTNDQPLVDAPHRDLRRGRAAALSMIPTSTSATQALSKLFPSLAGRLSCLAIRVPTAQVSAVEMVVALRKDATLGRARELFREAAQGPLQGIVGYSDEELVSIDYRGDSRSAVIDGGLLALPSPRLLKVFGWYDNETGYSHRLLDLMLHLERVQGAMR